jgi:single-strand DNA-binding protein
MINNVVLIGRVTFDPEMRTTPTGLAVCNIGIAVERDYKNDQGNKETDFFSIVVWKKLAESVYQYVGKGSLIGVSGRLQSRKYERNGENRTSVEIVAESIQFLDRKKSGKNTGGENTGGESPPVDESDLPF